MWGKARKSLSSSSSGPLSKRLANDLMHKETTLNLYQEADLMEMLRSIPEFVAGMKATQGWAFCHPPTVKWSKIGKREKSKNSLLNDFFFKRHKDGQGIRACPQAPLYAISMAILCTRHVVRSCAVQVLR